MKGNFLCSVCKKNDAQGIYASPIAPVSLAYCQSCIESGADAYDIVVIKVASLKSRKADGIIGPRLQGVLTATLNITGHTVEEFYRDVKEKEKSFANRKNEINRK